MAGVSQKTAGQILKALYSATVACLGALGTSISGTQTISSLHDSQWVWIALTTLVAGGGTFGLSGWTGPTLNGGKPPA